MSFSLRSKVKGSRIKTCSFLLAALLLSHSAFAMGKKKSQVKSVPADLKRTVAIDHVPERFIELPNPNDPVRFYGGNLHLKIVHTLNESGAYVIEVPEKDMPVLQRMESSEMTLNNSEIVLPDPILSELYNVASSIVHIRISELGFTTGSRGERVLYGFKPPHENAYNAGEVEENGAIKRNEYPMRFEDRKPSWFEKEFSIDAAESDGLLTGLELGHEINFDVLLAGALLKYARYKARMALDVEFKNRVGKIEKQKIEVKAKGFYYDFTGHFNYQGADYMLGGTYARKAALHYAFERTVEAAAKLISDEIKKLPLFTRISAFKDGSWYISAGANFNVQPGQRFYDLTEFERGKKPTLVIVEEVFQRISRVRFESGTPNLTDEVVSLKPGEQTPTPENQVEKVSFASTSVNAIQEGPVDSVSKLIPVDLGELNIPLPKGLKKFEQSSLARFWAGIKALVTLPYRAWRYFQYDQKFEGGELKQINVSRARELAKSSWALQAIGLPEAWNTLGLGARNVVVAVIDSGVDYNHPELRRNIFWDGIRNAPGWDFISGDSRPYDDHAHGTEIASQITGGGDQMVGVAPNTTVLPLKVFNPYGQTNSGAIYGAFKYAIESGAKIIVTAWASEINSQALKDAVALAHERGVLVIAAAGDYGQDISRRPYYPAALAQEFENVLTVAGYSKAGHLKRGQGDHSNYGAFVQLAAPGEDVLAARPRGSYKRVSHTGVAAGLVSGAAALVLGSCSKLKPVEAKNLLLKKAKIQPQLRNEVLENKALFLGGLSQSAEAVCN